MLFWKQSPKKDSRAAQRCFVLGLDGLGMGLLERLLAQGAMPVLSELMRRASVSKMRSVIPTVSSVAWASYATGVNPGMHNLFGFVDREPNPFRIFIPNATHLRHETLWEALSRSGKRVAVLNVPVSFPPKPVNGVMVGCFLSPSLDKAVYPASLLPTLKEMGYGLDVDAWKARQDLGGFLDELEQILESRFEVSFWLMEQEPWDFFQLHVMETDRINHFLLGLWEDGQEPWCGRFKSFYSRLDSWLGRLLEKLQGEMEKGQLTLILMSDHGFCRLESEFQVNHWLEKQGYLFFEDSAGRKLHQFLGRSRAYSLIPGRIFINLKGREDRGSVSPGAEYQDLRKELAEALLQVRDPWSNKPMVRRVHLREEIYRGPFLDRAPDLILEPEDGFDPKANTDSSSLTSKGHISGMHTLEDAFLLRFPGELPKRDFRIQDVAPGIMSLLGQEGALHCEAKGWS